MPMIAFDAVDTLADRPAVQHSSSFDGCAFGDVVSQDLDDLASRVNTAIRHCGDLSRSVPATSSPDTQRDMLHLQARIEGIARQIEDAKRTLQRMQQRTGAGRPGKQTLKQSLP